MSEAAPPLFKPIIALMHAGWFLQLYWFYYTVQMLIRYTKRAKDKITDKEE